METPRLGVLVFLVAYLIDTTTCETYTHDTRLGQIIGLKTQFENITIYKFKKIPYAKPPLSSLRFEKPLQFGVYEKPLNATKYGPNCWQNLYENDKRLIPNWDLSEDCLHLNIFAPTDMRNTSLRAVMIWIHGGGFTNGEGMMVDGSRLAAKGNVVIVTINYRLNIFGFANAGDGSPRNIGLWDQRFAIKWVKDNIMDYGGNSKMITIFGESAGGVSVGLQSMIPKNLGLFQRTIAHSGSGFGIRDIDDTEKLTREIGGILNCAECQSKVVECLDCLRNISAQDLLEAFDKGGQALHGEFSVKNTIGPSVDGDLIPDDPLEMLSDVNSASSRMFNSIDFIAGTNDCEAGLFYFNLIGVQNKFKFDVKRGIPSRVVCDHIAPYISDEIFKGCDRVSQEICKTYSPESDLTESLKQQTDFAVNLYGDLEFASLTVQELEFHTRSQKNTYQYLFTHDPSWGLIANRPSWLKCANHADELVYVFGLKEWYPKDLRIILSEAELSAKMMSYWLNFAKTGDPNKVGAPLWPKYNREKRHFHILGEYRNSTVDGFVDRMKFWNVNIPKLVKECQTNHSATIVTNGVLLTLVVLFSVVSYNCFI